MNGSYQIVGETVDEKARAVLAEDIFIVDGSDDWYIAHEVQLTVRCQKSCILWSQEIDSVIAVLQKVKELAAKRLEQFYASDAVESLSTPNP